VTKSEWGEGSGLQNTPVSLGENHGDLPSHFVVEYNNTIAQKTEQIFKIGEVIITVGNKTNSPSYSNLIWDSKTGLVTANIDGGSAREVVMYSGDSCGTIPTEGVEREDISLPAGATLQYHYWYY
jgi:hypothetical protein